MIDQVGGRKAAALIIVLALGVAAVLWKGDVPENFSFLLQFLFGAFVAGNVGATMASRNQPFAGETDTPEAEITPQMVDLAPVLSQIEELKAQNQQLQAAVGVTSEGIKHIIIKAKLTS